MEERTELSKRTEVVRFHKNSNLYVAKYHLGKVKLEQAG